MSGSTSCPPPTQLVPVSPHSSTSQEWPATYLNASNYDPPASPPSPAVPSDRDRDTLVQDILTCMEDIETWLLSCSDDEDMEFLYTNERMSGLRHIINYHRVHVFGMGELREGNPGMGPGLYEVPPCSAAEPSPPVKRRLDLSTILGSLTWRPKKKTSPKRADSSGPANTLVFPDRQGVFQSVVNLASTLSPPPPDTCEFRPYTLARPAAYLVDGNGQVGWYHQLYLYTKCEKVLAHTNYTCQSVPARPNKVFISMTPPPDGSLLPSGSPPPNTRPGSGPEFQNTFNSYGESGQDIKVQHFLRQVEASHTQTLHTTPCPKHYDSETQSIVDYPWYVVNTPATIQ
ncbi:hypothetical protein EST38_g12087 [Candolleomyces aberdarensis]|uniref:Uncharacterized protein n=1 Tax=Candolleomyces aberdarensis TaxID=2316362 RepID=A0A4Q2D6G8_9AGAR|nr:hypothetical protein EST38_g12087 [Candolleomyces aberdarensis]